MRGPVHVRRVLAERAQLEMRQPSLDDAQPLAARATTLTTFVTIHPSTTAADSVAQTTSSAPEETTQPTTSPVTSTLETAPPATSTEVPPETESAPATTESSELPFTTSTDPIVTSSPSTEVVSTESHSAVPTTSSTPLTSSTPSITHASTSSTFTSSPTAASSSASASAVTSPDSNQGLSSGAIAGITIAAIAGFFFLGFLCMYIIRKRALARRRRSGDSLWISAPLPEISNSTNGRPASLRPFLLDAQRPAPPPPVTPPATVTYGNVAAERKQVPSGMLATVSSTYTPSMPDELAVSVGDKLKVVREFDDGWCECVNGVGKKGMVPVECLEGRSWWSAPQGDYQTAAERHKSQRVSSMYASYTPNIA
ncbi:hypothetical protein HDZ31DRAFT_40306 [Schizophyllum fasciatum]